MQQGIDFAEARETLNKLEKYVQQKIDSKNNANQSAMNLATQPSFEGDHLGDETPLTPVMPESAMANDQSATSLLDNGPTTQDQAATQTMEQLTPPVPALEGSSDVGTSSLNNDSVLSNDNNAASVDFTNVPGGMGVDLATNTPVPQTIDNLEPVSPIITETTTPIMQENVIPSPVIPGTEQMGINMQNNGTLSQGVEQLGMSADTSSLAKDETSLEDIPNIDLSGVFSETNNQDTKEEGYKAINNTSTVGYPSEPAPADIPVVMPNGSNQGAQTDGSLVVGPEAFNMTR